MSEATVIYIGTTVFLLLANAYFAAIEYALLRSELFQFKKSEDQPDKDLEQIQSNLGEYLSVAGTCRALILLLFGFVTLSWLIPVLLMPFENLGLQVESWTYALAAVAAVAVTLVFQFIASDLLAKGVALELSNQGIKRLLPLLRAVRLFILPIHFALNASSKLARSVFGIRDGHEFHKTLATSELVLLASRGTDQQPLDIEEKEMLQGVFSLSETIVREVMTPRTDVVAIQFDAPLQDVVQIIGESNFSRFPVYGKNRDDIKGVLLAKDLMPLIGEKEAKWSMADFIRDPFFVPETKAIDDLMAELKGGKFHLAIVVDEHGGFSGVVTLEDLLEEIVGEIFDESDEAQSEILECKPGHYELDGGVLVTDINEYLDPKLPEGEYDTIAGFIFTHLGKIPETGAKLVVGHNYELKELLNGSADNFEADDLFHTGIADLYVESEPSQLGKTILITVTSVNGHRIEQVDLKEVQANELLGVNTESH